MASIQFRRPAAILAVIIYLALPTIYFSVEWYASRLFVPYYSYFTRFTSELGIPYAYTDPETGHFTNSWRAVQMNLNFVVAGLLFLAGQICLQQATGPTKFSTSRMIIAVLYCIGIILVAVVPGGPKERESGNVRWHGLGATLAIVGGNVNSILIGLATPSSAKPVYRASCLALGTAGLAGLFMFFMAKQWGMKGLWQRSSIYPTLFWEYLTAGSLIYELLRDDGHGKRD